MALDSDHLCLADDLHVCQALAIGTIIIKPPRADRIGRGDDAEQALAQRIAPGAHGTHIALARMQPAHWMRVHEADNVALQFLATKGPRPVGGHAGGLPAAIAQAPATPPPPPAHAHKRP
jgi:hypothetical protein